LGADTKIQGDRAFLAGSLYGTGFEPAYSGALSFLRRNYSRDLTGVDVAVLGVPFDMATSNRPGARFGPRSVREASAELAWGPHFPWGFDPFERLAVVDYGDVLFEYGDPRDLVTALQSEVARILAAGVETLCIGGDHFITLPILREQAEVHGPISLVHFDAHTDTEEEGGEIDHGTMFRTAIREGIVAPERSVQVGIRTHYERDEFPLVVLDAPRIHRNGVDDTVAAIKAAVGDAKAYLTFDIDCLDPSFAPGTGTPVVGGLSSAVALEILRGLSDLHWVGMDVVEVAPAYDVGNITALAAATLAMEYLCIRASSMPTRRDDD
jgi:agmatinase